MSLPSGVSTATLTVGVPVTFSGSPVRSTITISPSAFLVHTATGNPLVNMVEDTVTTDGVAAQFTLPHTDQDGFQDENGNAYKNWYYTATIQYQTDKATKPAFTKVFQLAVGQTTVDLDLLPGGAPAMPYTAPIATVTSVNGSTGAVTVPTTTNSDVAGFVSGAGPTATALNATYASTKDLVKSAPKQATKALATTTSKQHFRKLSLGDSIANFKWRFMYDPLKRAWGGSDPGASIGAGETGTGWSLPGITPTATTGTITDVGADFDAWFSGITSRYATGATRTYGIGGVNATWDSAKVYYVKGATADDGGTFKVQVDGVDETGMTSVATTSGTIDLGILTVTRGSAAARALKVVNLTGAHRIIGVAFFDSTRGGVINGTVSQGGIPLNSAIGTAGARTTLAAYLTDYQPDLITFEMKEDSSYYAASLVTLLDLIKTAVPTATVVGIGSTPTATTDADQVIQNAQLKAACFAHGYTYWDGYTPVTDYPTLNALGWAGDGTHVSDTANAFLSGLMLDDLHLLSHPALRSSTRGVSAPKVMADNRIDLGAERTDGDPLKVLALDGSAGSGFDAKLILRRELDIVPLNGTVDTNSWMLRPDNAAAQQIPYGVRVGSSGPYLQGGGSTLQIKDARGGGNLVAIEVDRVKTTKVELAANTTANRPASAPDGMVYYDSTIGKPIIRNGGVWKELTMGATV